jgi:excisionase family DNA binding protein
MANNATREVSTRPPVSRPLTMAEAAAAVGASRRWLQDFLRTHHMPYLRVGNRKMFDELALSALKEEMRHRDEEGPNPPYRRPVLFPESRRAKSELERALALAQAKPRSRSR